MKRYSKYILYFIIFILLIFIIKLIFLNRDLINSLPYFIKGEKIKYFDLVDMNGKEINAQLLKKDTPSIIFIFSRPCSPCNRNIIYWRRMSDILKGKVNIYGIVLDSISNAKIFASKSELNFPIFVPQDLSGFIKRFRIKLNLPETILYKEGVIRSILGEVDGRGVAEIIKSAKGVIK